MREARKAVLKADRRAGNQPEAVAVLAVDPVLAADLVAGLELGQVAGQVVEAVLVLAVDQVEAVEAVPELAVDPVEVAAGPVAVAVAEAVFHSWSSQIQFSRLCRCR